VTNRRAKSKAAQTRDSKLVVLARSQGDCEVRIPGVCLGRATNYHHRLRREFGDERPENYIHLCGSGTTGCHGWIEHNRTESYEKGWLVKSTGDPAKIRWGRWSE
jgi:hypothetical protein